MNVVSLVTQLASADVGSCDAAGLAEVLAAARQVRGWLDGIVGSAARRAAQLRSEGAGREPEVALQRSGGLSKREARDVAARDAVLSRSPEVADALRRGLITGAHADAFGRALALAPAVADHAADLVRVATGASPAEFEAHCKRLASVLAPDDGLELFERQRRATRLRRWIDEATGMYRIAGEFDPESGEKLWRAINRQIEAMFHASHPDTAPAEPGAKNDHLAALALVACATSGGAAGAGTARAEVNVLIDLETLLHGWHSASTAETSTGGTMPVSVIRKWACEADIIPIVLGGDGVVLDLGRAKRLATADQRRALRAMYPTCVVDGCCVAFDHCQVHHFDPWTRDGPTNLARMGPLCSQHHDRVHHGGWTIRGLAHGVIVVTLPCGTEYRTVPRRGRPAA